MKKSTLLNMKIQSVVYDELYTPMRGIAPILNYLKPNSKILCPFDTVNSNYVKLLKANEHTVVYSHKDNEIDFFSYTAEDVKDFDYIISNPPYSLKDGVLAHLYKLGKPFLMLLPITALEGIQRNKLYKEFGIELIILNKRLDFTGKGANYFNTSYFCWQVLKDKQIAFEEIE